MPGTDYWKWPIFNYNHSHLLWDFAQHFSCFFMLFFFVYANFVFFFLSHHIAYIQRPLHANDLPWEQDCWRISICMLYQHLEQPHKRQRLLHVETWHSKEQWKEQKREPFQTRKRRLVQYNSQRIQKNYWHPMENLKHAHSLRGALLKHDHIREMFCFSSPSFLCSLLYWEQINSSLPLPERQDSVFEISPIFL